jgi:hypothetical protein
MRTNVSTDDRQDQPQQPLCPKCDQPMQPHLSEYDSLRGEEIRMPAHSHVVFGGRCLKHEHFCTTCGEHSTVTGCGAAFEQLHTQRGGVWRGLEPGWAVKPLKARR